jgi:predicted ATP-dependent endonuclease of OLD family
VRISRLAVRNFRLLASVELGLEELTTLVVGRNNSGKTSMSEVVRRFLEHDKPVFQLEDFSSACYDCFSIAYERFTEDEEEEEIRKLIPAIELRLTLEYDAAKPFNLLGDFVIDVEEDVNTALAVVRL